MLHRLDRITVVVRREDPDAGRNAGDTDGDDQCQGQHQSDE